MHEFELIVGLTVKWKLDISTISYREHLEVIEISGDL